MARPHVELIQLTVGENIRARRLYASLGFVDYGLETKALKQGGRYFDEYLMMKDLSQTRQQKVGSCRPALALLVRRPLRNCT